MKIHDFLLSASLFGLAQRAAAKTQSCKASSFKGIEVPGLEIVDVAASEQHEFTQWMSLFTVMGVPTGTPVDFCNVTVTVTHPGQGDHVHVYVWLPLGEDKWNGRLLGEGGGGWHAGIDTSLAQGVANGFVSANTDAGHSHYDGFPGILSSGTWSLRSPGNVDWNLLQNFASRSVGDLPKVAKEVIKSYYGKPVKYAYWQGCSTGGRQGLMSAQRFAGDYDGILSIAPATNWASFLVTEQWPQLVMRQHNYLPSQCEFNAIHQAAIDECDELDGVKDRIIAATGLCKFDATNAVGRSYECDGVSGKVSKTAAKIANKIWEGPKRNGQNEWFGSTHDMPFGGPGPIDGLANTACDDKGKNCQALPFPISEDWVKMFLAKDPEYDVKKMTEDEFWAFLAQSRREYSSIMGTDYPDLSEFKATGGKLIQWHGLADQLIFPNGSSNYFERVLELDSAARDFYRYFDVPGVLHCAGGPGAFPTGALDALIEWVEKGVAPEKIDGQVPPNAEALAGHERIFCPYPLVAAYKGGDTSKKESYECADSFDKFKSSWGEHTEL